MLRFIVNPAAKSGRGRDCMDQISKSLDLAGVEYEVYETEAPGHAGHLAVQLAEKGTTLLGVVGGDGTLNELVSVDPSSLPPVFYVPYGSGNDFARGIKLKVNADNAPSLAVNSSSLKASPVDIGQAIVENGIPHRFLVSGGIGFDAAVCFDLEKGTVKKKLNRLHLGFLSYLILGIKNMLTCPLAEGTLNINDGEEILPIKHLAFMSAQNLPYEGGGFYFAPRAVSHDGKLDLCVMTAKNHFRFILLLIGTVLKGRHIKMKGVHYIQCRKARLTLDRALPVHTDGETIAYTNDVIFQTDSAAISVLQ